jgi:hypothetical protein
VQVIEAFKYQLIALQHNARRRLMSMVKRTYANNHKTKYPQQCIQLRFYHDRFKVLAMSKATKQQKSYYLDDLAKAQGLIRWVRPIEKCR